MGLDSRSASRLPHGGQRELAAKRYGCAPEEVLDLSTGLYPDGPPPWLGAWLERHASLAGRYPEPEGEPARGALAAALRVPTETVLVTSGAQALIEVLFSALSWRSVAIARPSYREPIRCAERAGTRVLLHALGDPAPEADARWVTDPHNPSGQRVSAPVSGPGVIDESYLPWDLRQQVGVLPEWIRIGSLTKLFAIPGLRLGYAVVGPDLRARIEHWLPPWPAGTLALHLLPELLPEAAARDASVARGRTRLANLLRQRGFQLIESQASFVLAKPPEEAKLDWDAHRILVRTFPEWQELSDWIRFGIPGPDREWSRLEAALWG